MSFDATQNKAEHIAFKEKVEHLFSLTRLRDQTAFETLYGITSSKLYGLILKMVADKDTAADILQESYSKIWHQADSYFRHSDENWAWAWICQLTRHTALDHIRRVGRRAEIQLEEINLTKFNDETQQLSEQRDLNYCLAKLNPEPRKVIVLAYVHGFSHSELAGKLQTPIGTLKSWIRRGLKELALCLKS